jgi:hypothetical protein
MSRRQPKHPVPEEACPESKRPNFSFIDKEQEEMENVQVVLKPIIMSY